jgi:CHAT domain-containing protein
MLRITPDEALTAEDHDQQRYLPPDTVLLEYFVIRGTLVAFVVTADAVQARPLACTLSQVRRQYQLLQVNLNLTPHSAPAQVNALRLNARGLLHQLHQLLLAPLLDDLRPYRKFIIVPHDVLHYLPFHAFYDGAHYLVEQHEISYLPGASLLRDCRETKPATTGAFIYGHSWYGKLPNAVNEAGAIASLFGATAHTEEAFQPAQLQSLLGDRRLIHFATHSDFRADNPLFSGLVVGDGWLTTLDVFNLRLRASLVTLSGCQTGRNVLRGSDELIGLMRAFLSAGAASLVLSLWAVEDQATAYWMETFYRNLAAGSTKGAALRAAQLQLIQGAGTAEAPSTAWDHPYFWAPFFLVGDSGLL